ncbi:YolD-like family protein [Paenibacillus sp. FSL P2-0536]|uniref:YolD-like family protein n=1 Tax=Paenibacillus sp. FSL P2-0536 TaxID=2921629 RepID=UPI0030F50231
MRRKLEGNGLWESSRMIMPEHEQRIIFDRKNEVIRNKPELDPQAIEEIQRVMAQSVEEHIAISITLFDPAEDLEIRGIVMRVDQQLKQIKFRTSDDEWNWIKLSDVIAADY